MRKANRSELWTQPCFCVCNTGNAIIVTSKIWPLDSLRSSHRNKRFCWSYNVNIKLYTSIWISLMYVHTNRNDSSVKLITMSRKNQYRNNNSCLSFEVIRPELNGPELWNCFQYQFQFVFLSHRSKLDLLVGNPLAFVKKTP